MGKGWGTTVAAAIAITRLCLVTRAVLLYAPNVMNSGAVTERTLDSLPVLEHRHRSLSVYFPFLKSGEIPLLMANVSPVGCREFKSWAFCNPAFISGKTEVVINFVIFIWQFIAQFYKKSRPMLTEQIYLLHFEGRNGGSTDVGAPTGVSSSDRLTPRACAHISGIDFIIIKVFGFNARVSYPTKRYSATVAGLNSTH